MRARSRPSLVLFAMLTACNTADAPDDDASDPGTDPGDGGGPRAGAPFFLPTTEPDNTSAPVVEVDGAGGVHAVYPAYSGGGAYYAYCGDDCNGPDEVSVVRFETSTTVANALLALDPQGRPHVLLSAYASIYHATCTGACTDATAWTTTEIVQHGGDREVTGDAFALDARGLPRFLMHTYVAHLGVGQKAHATYWVTCDGACTDPTSWTSSKVADQIWRSTSLRLDAEDRPRAAASAIVVAEDLSSQNVGAYLECNGDCSEPDSWVGQGLAQTYINDFEAVAIKPTISLALTASGAPRIVMMSQDDASQRNISYWSCDSGCVDGDWSYAILRDGTDLGPTVDLTLTAQDKPRFVYTDDYSIFIARCDGADCALPDTQSWTLNEVEMSSDMSPDQIFLYPNCTVSAWFLHSPSIALAANGSPRVGYQARDISGGTQNPNPDETPDCIAGTDMTWTRLAILR